MKTARLLAIVTFMLAPAGVSMPAPADVRIPPSGESVLTAASPSAKAEVRIDTGILEDGCADSCPSSRAWKAWGLKQVSVVQDMKISINSAEVPVALSAYASLFAPGRASLRFENGRFVLRIDGADGGESYFVLLYFDKRGLSELKLYAAEFPSKPTQVTHYFNVTVE